MLENLVFLQLYCAVFTRQSLYLDQRADETPETAFIVLLVAALCGLLGLPGVCVASTVLARRRGGASPARSARA